MACLALPVHQQAPQRGAVYEKKALDYLETQGLKLVARNVRGRYGEIDLIMRDLDCLVFVEVRARSCDSYGGAMGSLTPAKCKRWWKTAAGYLVQHPHSGPVRFDFVAITPTGITWLKDILQEDNLYAP